MKYIYNQILEESIFNKFTSYHKRFFVAYNG